MAGLVDKYGGWALTTNSPQGKGKSFARRLVAEAVMKFASEQFGIPAVIAWMNLSIFKLMSEIITT
ncbi:MAG: hypothetical protein AB8B86_09700 [Pseudomonadales bacterium]